MTEREVVTHMVGKLLDLGCETVLWCNLGSGRTSLQPHVKSGSKKLEKGDIVRVDTGGDFDGYMADSARSAVVGKPTQRQRDLYRMLRDAQQKTIASMRPGVRCKDVFFSCQKAFHDTGYDYFLPHAGHSFGIGLHENPMLQPFDETELLPNMIFNVEPMYIDPGVAAYHVEDLVLVTDDEPVVLSDRTNADELFVIG